MIIYKTSSIYDSDADMLLCPVNAEGVFEEGITIEFRLRFPDAMERYKKQGEKGNICFGRMYLVKDTKKNKNICILPMKEVEEDNYEYKNIKIAINILKKYIDKNKNIKLAIPKFEYKEIGWKAIKSIIEDEFLSSDNDIYIYEER